MATSFMQMAEAAMAQVEGISAEEARRRSEKDSNVLLLDVRDASDIPSTGLAAGGLNISLGMLPVKADLELPEEWREAGLQDRSRPVVTTCQIGPNGCYRGESSKGDGLHKRPLYGRRNGSVESGWASD